MSVVARFLKHEGTPAPYPKAPTARASNTIMSVALRQRSCHPLVGEADMAQETQIAVLIGSRMKKHRETYQKQAKSNKTSGKTKGIEASS